MLRSKSYSVVTAFSKVIYSLLRLLVEYLEMYVLYETESISNT